LRGAIEYANAFPEADTINFAIPVGGLHTISLLSDLPQIRERVTIDGCTEVLDEEASPAARANTAPTGTNAVLRIVLDGTSSGLANGLALSGPAASNSVIRGLVFPPAPIPPLPSPRCPTM
jgi:hypothetical protein